MASASPPWPNRAVNSVAMMPIVSVNAKRRAAIEGAESSEQERPDGTVACAEARKALGKQARLEETARRSGKVEVRTSATGNQSPRTAVRR